MMLRTWCCNTEISKPHESGCELEPRFDNPVDYDGNVVVTQGDS